MVFIEGAFSGQALLAREWTKSHCRVTGRHCSREKSRRRQLMSETALWITWVIGHENAGTVEFVSRLMPSCRSSSHLRRSDQSRPCGAAAPEHEGGGHYHRLG